MVLAPPTWPAAASTRAPEAVDGPPAPATVLAAFPTALYLRLGPDDELLPVIAAGGLRLPTAVTVARPLPALGWGVQPGQTVGVGRGRLELPGAVVQVVRRWRPARVPFGAAPRGPAVAAALDAAAGGALLWRKPAGLLTRTVVSQQAEGRALGTAVSSLVGAGAGLTPSGDDVLAGVLLGLRLHGSADALRRLWAAVAPRLGTTTTLSAALLRQARQGYAVDPVVRLTDALCSGPPDGCSGWQPEVERAVREVLAVGHSSGADLLGGLAGCLQALASPEPGRLSTVPLAGGARS